MKDYILDILCHPLYSSLNGEFIHMLYRIEPRKFLREHIEASIWGSFISTHNDGQLR